MIKKKELDIKSIVESAFVDAKKDHGLIKEQETSQASIEKIEPFSEKFDVEKHLSYIQILPKKFGLKGSVEAADIDAVVEAISNNQPAGLDRFKTCLNNMNSLLAKKVGEFGLPTSENNAETETNAKTIFSALQLNYLLVSIINKQDARVAGKMFEGLVARMLGGTISNAEDSIEDMVVDQGGGVKKLISLKTLDPNKSDVKGSKYNLAKAIADGAEITYLICEKDRRNDPFSFNTYSFSINRNNFFNFLIRKQGTDGFVDYKELQNAINDIVVGYTFISDKKIGESLIKEAKLDKQAIFDAALTNYAVNNLGANEQDRDDLIRKIRDALKLKIANSIGSQAFKTFDAKYKKFSDQFLNNIKVIENSIPDSFGKKILNRNSFEAALLNLRDIYSMSLSNEEKAKYLDTTENLTPAQISNNVTAYNKIINSLLAILNPLMDLFEKIEKAYKSEELETHKKNVETGKDFASSSKEAIQNTPVYKEIDNFFNELKTNQNIKQRTGGATQFQILGNTMKSLAISLGADYDDSYGQFIVSSGFALTNASKNTEILKNWIKPIYEEFYKIDTGLKKFFIKDDPDGLKGAYQGTLSLKTEIENVPMEQGTETYRKASQLKENVQKPLTKHWTDIMLEELLK